MIEEFKGKLSNNEYISNYLYEYVLKNNSSVIPIGFNIDNYNNKILDKLYIDNKEYFDNMYKGIDDSIHLDEEQCKAILADEKYSLIIAGAGTGKTTTMVSRVKYLVDKKNANPERILVMSYTRKATEEIKNRIKEYFDLNVHVTTFHSLGYEYIKELWHDRKPSILDRNTMKNINYKYFSKLFENKNNIKEIISGFESLKSQGVIRFLFGKYFLDNYEKYKTYDEFLDAYVKYKIEEARNMDGGFKKLINENIDRQLKKDRGITTLKGEYVKSAGELVIANFLYMHGIEYSYEEVYDELMKNNSIYKPDFTIDYGGVKIYIEYFGLNDIEYNKIRKLKEDFHREKGNRFIEINRLPLEKIEEELDNRLKEYGIVYNEVSDEKIYENLLRQNPTSQVYPFLDFLNDCVRCRKESFYRDNLELAENFIKEKVPEDSDIRVQYKYIRDFDNFYANELFGGAVYYFDFEDLLYYSVKYLERLTIDTKLLFDYIIIDEYQDISQVKYELTYKTAKRNDAKVYAVGDDWQSIYSFSGSRIEYIYKFKEFFKGAKSFKISKTYRNSQELIDYSGEFIMRNNNQIKKQLVSDKHINNPIEFRYFDNYEGENREIECLKRTIKEIYEVNPNHRILILGRTNYIVNKITSDMELIDDIGSKITFIGYEDIQIDGMTMHKSKGLTYDEVIIIGLSDRFPSVRLDNYWYISLYKNKPFPEAISFAEERRLFYVALTRTKNKVYLIVNSDSSKQSDFVKEIKGIVKSKRQI